MHEIKDSHTGKTIKVCKTRAGAIRACAKMNLEYGATRYTYRGVAS